MLEKSCDDYGSNSLCLSLFQSEQLLNIRCMKPLVMGNDFGLGNFQEAGLPDEY